MIYALTGSFLASSTSWLVDSGASRNMTGNRGTLTSYRKKKFTTQVELGDDSTYKIEGVGSTSLQLDSSTVLHIDDILYVPSLKKNLLSIVGLEDKGHRVLFMDKKVFLWAKDANLESTVQIGVQEGDLYKASKVSTHALVHHTVDLVNFGIEGLDTFTTQLSQDCRRWFGSQVCQMFLQSVKEFAKDVL